MLPVQDIRDRLLARARALGLDADSEERLLDALLDREVPVPTPTEDDCRRFYVERPELFRSGDLVEADHILFAVTDNVPLAPLRERAQQVLDALLAAPERFASLAAEYSNCPSAQVGGNLGQLARGDVVPEFWQALAQFEGTGIMPRLVETRFGLHIVRVARRVEGRALPFETVKPQILARLQERNLRQALHEYAHALLHEAGEKPAASWRLPDSPASLLATAAQHGTSTPDWRSHAGAAPPGPADTGREPAREAAPVVERKAMPVEAAPEVRRTAMSVVEVRRLAH